ncbi:MAG: hypothetical protein H0X24_24885 [Ktedonobacterales bacterium]|nr:hypothetical protein [Ktedonobacterales bacterium]
MRIDKQYVQAVGAQLTAAQVAVLKRVSQDGQVLKQLLTEDEQIAVIHLAARQLVVEEARGLKDANGTDHQLDVVRLMPLGRDVLRELPRQGVRHGD